SWRGRGLVGDALATVPRVDEIGPPKAVRSMLCPLPLGFRVRRGARRCRNNARMLSTPLPSKPPEFNCAVQRLRATQPIGTARIALSTLCHAEQARAADARTRWHHGALRRAPT